MKKLLTLIAALAVAASLCACGGMGIVGSDNNSQNDSSSSITDTSTNSVKNSDGEEYTYDHIKLVLPEGFTVDDNSSVPIAYGPNYPTETDNITFSKSGADNIDNYSKDVIETQYKQLINGFEEIDDFKKIKIDGKDTIKISYDISMSGVDMEQTQYFIFGDSFTNIVTFTDVTGNYDDAFEDCVKTITVD